MNLGEERYYEVYVKVSSTDSRKVRELPFFYKKLEEVKDLPELFFSPVLTENIPDSKTNSTLMTDERKK